MKWLRNLAITRCGPPYFYFLSVHTWDIFHLSRMESCLLYFSSVCCYFQRLPFSFFCHRHTAHSEPHRRDITSSSYNIKVLKNQLSLEHHGNYLCPDTNHLHETLVCFMPLMILFICSSYQHP